MTSFLHKRTENECRIDVSDEVASTKLFAAKQLTSQQQNPPHISSFSQSSLQAKSNNLPSLHKTNPPTQHISNMPRDGSGAGDNAIEAGHNITHGDAGGVSLDSCFI